MHPTYRRCGTGRNTAKQKTIDMIVEDFIENADFPRNAVYRENGTLKKTPRAYAIEGLQKLTRKELHALHTMLVHRQPQDGLIRYR